MHLLQPLSITSLVLFVFLARQTASVEIEEKLLQSANKIAKSAEAKNIFANLDRAALAEYNSSAQGHTAYRNCFPSVMSGVYAMSELLDLCGACIYNGPCPPQCCITPLPEYNQIVLCSQDNCCMRLFGAGLIALWSWDGTISDINVFRRTCGNQTRNMAACGTPCAVRFGLDDEGFVTLAPCPIGDPTGFSVPNVHEKTILPVGCTAPPPFRNWPSTVTSMDPTTFEETVTISTPTTTTGSGTHNASEVKESGSSGSEDTHSSSTTPPTSSPTITSMTAATSTDSASMTKLTTTVPLTVSSGSQPQGLASTTMASAATSMSSSVSTAITSRSTTETDASSATTGSQVEPASTAPETTSPTKSSTTTLAAPRSSTHGMSQVVTETTTYPSSVSSYNTSNNPYIGTDSGEEPCGSTEDSVSYSPEEEVTMMPSYESEMSGESPHVPLYSPDETEHAQSTDFYYTETVTQWTYPTMPYRYPLPSPETTPAAPERSPDYSAHGDDHIIYESVDVELTSEPVP